ncbi:MAG: hypothetical protein IT457_11415 [Planctomycetes bacterium]|nr:hypothetical protein [Planctomycetota bacterium]
MVKDITPGPGSGFEGQMAAVGADLVFAGNDGVTGTELWATQGTEASTRLLVDLYPGLNASSPPSRFTEVGAIVFFTAITAAAGQELFRTDGTVTGTGMVRDINPGPSNCLAEDLLEVDVPGVGRRLFFSAETSAGRELWISAGTAGTTNMVRDIAPGAASGFRSGANNNSPAAMIACGGRAYFIGQDSNGGEPWTSDGSANGTIMLTEHLSPGPLGAVASTGVALGNTLFFSATSQATGYELFRTDGTVASTVLAVDINPGPTDSGVSQMIVAAGAMYFAAQGNSAGYELWRSDGTPAGTQLVQDINPNGSSNPRPNGEVPPRVLFTATDGTGDELWASDGTAAGTTRMADITPPETRHSEPVSITDGGSTPFTVFTASAPSVGWELWRTDGTPSGTSLLKDIYTGINSSQPDANAAGRHRSDYKLAFGGKVYFGAIDATRGGELWVTDGTPSGTVLLKDLTPGPTGSVPLYLQLGLGGFVFSQGSNLWKSDGTAAGTVLVTTSAYLDRGTAMLHGQLIFVGRSATSGFELWKTDGTPSGTSLLADIWPGPDSSQPFYLTRLGDRVLFAATDGVTGQELWQTDGTNVSLLADIHPGIADSGIADLTASGGKLYFSAADSSTLGVLDTELWCTDGTVAGTTRVRDIRQGTNASLPRNLTDFMGTLLFTANDGIHGSELWRSDGTAQGTSMVRDVYPGAASGFPTLTFPTVTVNATFIMTLPGAERAIFAAVGQSGGIELWRTDGTHAGTVLHSDVRPGIFGSNPGLTAGQLKVVPPALGINRIYFRARDGVHGVELWSMPAMAASVPFGAACPGTGGLSPVLSGASAPRIGNAAYAIELADAVPGSAALLLASLAATSLPLGGGCWLHVDSPPIIWPVSTGSGAALISFPIPPIPSLAGQRILAQAAVADPAGSYQGMFAITSGLSIILALD